MLFDRERCLPWHRVRTGRPPVHPLPNKHSANNTRHRKLLAFRPPDADTHQPRATRPHRANRHQVVGITVEAEGAGRASISFTPAEEEKFLAMSRTPDIYQKMASSISPSISGDYTVDIKRALACLLFGGSRKVG